MAFDATQYESVSQTNVPGTLAVVRAVLTAGKGGSHPAAKKALKRLREVGEKLRELHQATPPARVASLTRDADNAVDRIWSAIDQRLSAHLELTDDDAAEAARVQGILLPNGLSFLKAKYTEEWAESEAAIGRISSEKLEASLDHLVGKKFVTALRDRHRAYGHALGITQAKAPEVDADTFVEPLRETRRALSTYVRVVVAAVENGDLGDDHAASALAPIDALRKSTRASKKKGEPDAPVDAGAAPTGPLPPIE